MMHDAMNRVNSIIIFRNSSNVTVPFFKNVTVTFEEFLKMSNVFKNIKMFEIISNKHGGHVR